MVKPIQRMPLERTTQSPAILTPHLCSLETFRQLKISLADFGDFGDYELQFGSLTQPTYDESNEEVKSSDSNGLNDAGALDLRNNEQSIDLNEWTRDIVAVCTPVKVCEIIDPSMPNLDLED